MEKHTLEQAILVSLLQGKAGKFILSPADVEETVYVARYAAAFLLKEQEND